MIVLNSSVAVVGVQFSFLARSLVPASARRKQDETLEEMQARKKYERDGRLLHPITPYCEFHDLARLLTQAGYEFIDVVHQRRIPFSGGSRFYQLVRFVFVRPEFRSS